MTVSRSRWTMAFLLTIASLTLPSRATAQNWSFDARNIALGGVGSTGNIADNMIDKQRRYTSIPLPFGLIQILSDLDIYDPNSTKFDPIRAGENIASPFHYIVGRDTGNSGEAAFVSDLRNARLSLDLTKYQGFVPANDLLAEGVVQPRWGGTIKVHRSADGGYQGIYIGAGPYLSQHIAATFDSKLTTVLSTGVNIANAVMPITNADTIQAAAAVTGGYRGRFTWPGASNTGASREGVYVAVNFNYLHGLVFENDRLNVNLVTDRNGLITTTSNIFVNHQDATKGTGYAVDFGVGVVKDGWGVGFGANGVSNRIDWTGVTQTTYTLASVLSGNSNFLESATIPLADMRVELPVEYRGNITYDGGNWSAAAEAGHGFGGGSFHGGYEQRFGPFEARVGARYTFEMWNPSAGVGVDLTRRVAFDIAFFGTATNIERKRQLAIATSIRINHL